mmetsp:Transcript_35136/g.88547  ORF Transcript_35136/g.88547 Transcript_35136/m.88547 type:complete len:318 (+) Transcript_35136:303-1256(+)
MRVAVYGAGAVGGFFGGKLATVPSLDVKFVARGETLRVLRDNGLTLRTVGGDQVIRSFTATDRLEEVGEVDVVLVCTKAWQVPEVAEKVKASGMLGSDTVVVPLQNGMDSVDCLKDTLGAEHTAGGLCRIFAFIESPGCIRVPAKVATVDFGGLGNGCVPHTHRHLQALLAAFTEADVKATLSEDMWPEMWRKFMSICVLSGMPGITRGSWGEILDSPQTWAMCERCVAEAVAVANGSGQSFSSEYVQSVIQHLKSLPRDLTASMARDVVAGKPSELEAQLGAMVRYAEAAGVSAPTLSTIYAALLPQEARARAPQA